MYSAESFTVISLCYMSGRKSINVINSLSCRLVAVPSRCTALVVGAPNAGKSLPGSDLQLSDRVPEGGQTTIASTRVGLLFQNMLTDVKYLQ